MDRKDIVRGFIIGGGVGLLIQPILANNIPAKYVSYLTPSGRIGVFVFFLVLAPLALAAAKWLSRSIAGIYQFAQFAAVGTLNSFIDLGVLNVETFLYGTSLVSNGIFAAFKAISFLAATTNSFIWNKYWTFGARDKTNTKEVTAFYTVALVGWVLNVSAATLVKAYGPASATWVTIVAPLGGIVASFAWDFLGYKYLVFKKAK
jgi:putative flippase GtrA